jgi:hypothetical protein
MNRREQVILACGAVISGVAIVWRLIDDVPTYGGPLSVAQLFGACLMLLAPALGIWRRRQR